MTGLAVVVVLVLAPNTWAQNYARRGNSFNYESYDHASTEAEGALRGWASLWRAGGSYNYDTSLAIVNAELARSQYIENRLKAVQNYHEAKRINREARAAAKGQGLTIQQLAKIAQQGVPKPLTSSQYDVAAGKLYWPAILLSDVYTFQRVAIDRLIAERSPYESGLGSGNHHQISLLTAEMQELLKEQIYEVSPAEYMHAKKFLVSLEFESRSVLQPVGFTVR